MTRPSDMRAWRSSSPGLEELELARTTIPSFNADEALVRVETAALNFSDLLMIDDRYQIRPPRPFTPGQEISGAVVAAGAQSGLAAGQRVASKVLWGGFAEYVRVRGDMTIRVPDGMSSEAACALPVVYTTAMVALTENTVIRPGETVLVLAAAGGVGLAAVEIARHLGAHVIAAAGGEEKCLLARQHGAHESVDYRCVNWSEDIKRLTAGRGVDVILDPVGGAATKEALRMIAWDGRLLIVGFASGEIPQIPANRLLLKRVSAIGVYWDHDRDAAMLASVSAKLATFLQDGAIRPHVETSFSFDRLPQALKALAARQTTGKVAITLNNKDTA
ncbi:NADPH:quinone oxidoreductase family protein [Bradyrhizobium sp. Ash2021]|uniref:NADPH:quinone oxidoreductase family protein n=1 Tax=Bradyrhizobium sp. Ash2021 TaxID=2954771 RepID=UPI002815C2D8|nr:NADPH:quinone oxidoreductase family protein [Bradyrhizobium sp. Ash2021]WMT75956.1 NADPH:quinone oxidoreductase family protein [Bradyrhizobium sp. Ash2021]